MSSITYFNRDKRIGNYSIEELFSNIRSEINDDWTMFDYTYDIRKGIWKSIRDVRKYESQVNHITGDVNFLAYGLKPGKTILTVHDLGHYEKTLRGWKKPLYKQLWLRGPLNRVHYLTAISEFTKSRIIHHFGIPADKIRVIPNPVSPLFSAGPNAFDEACPKILQVGGGQTKNIDRLIAALHGIPCELILVRPYDPVLESVLKKEGIRYSWLSNLDYQSVADQYKNCHLVFFASEYEGFGMPILEGNAAGRPVLTGNVTAMPETAGLAACLVDPFDVSSIRNGILKIIKEPTYRQDLIANGYENIKRFALKDISVRYQQLYQDVLCQ